MTNEELEDDNIADENSDLIDNNDLENEEDQEDELDWEPECPISGTDEDNGIECEFNVQHGSWWCDTHNCWA